MYTLLTILIVIASLLLMLVVLVQNPKGGGLSAGFGGGGGGGANQMMGVKRTTDLLEQITWGLAIFILVCSLSMNLFLHRGTTDQPQDTELERQLQETQPGVPAQDQDLPALPDDL